jgi:hypothetical protein
VCLALAYSSQKNGERSGYIDIEPLKAFYDSHHYLSLWRKIDMKMSIISRGVLALAITPMMQAQTYYKISMGMAGETCNGYAYASASFSMFDTGDHMNFLVFESTPNTPYSYFIVDDQGSVTQVSGCRQSSNIGMGCNGTISLPRPIKPGITKAVFTTGYSVAPPNKPVIGTNPDGSTYYYYPSGGEFSPCGIAITGQQYFFVDPTRH